MQNITWINYLDQKPPSSGWYLIVAARLNNPTMVIEGYYRPSSDSFSEGSPLLGEKRMTSNVTITHWSELPSLP